MRLHMTSVILSLQMLLSFSAQASEAVWVICSAPNITQLSPAQLKQIYMEQGNQSRLTPLNLKRGARLRSIFNTRVIGLTESRIQSYWVQMKFTGRAKPPKEVQSVNQAVDFLTNNTGWVAYVPSGTALPDNVSVVHTIQIE